MSTALIVALDFHDPQEASLLLETLDPKSCAIKIGSELFASGGPAFIDRCVQKDYRVFLDLKLHDIPNTVSATCRTLSKLGIWMLNIHALGGLQMMQAAYSAIKEGSDSHPLLIAVTILTSFDASDLAQIGVDCTLEREVSQLAQLAKTAQLDGVVCSAKETSLIKMVCGSNFLTVTPGIRLTQDPSDDQKRTVTPLEALKTGSDYIVVGRPITQASDPAKVVTTILSTLSS